MNVCGKALYKLKSTIIRYFQLFIPRTKNDYKMIKIAIFLSIVGTLRAPVFLFANIDVL